MGKLDQDPGMRGVGEYNKLKTREKAKTQVLLEQC